MVFFEYHEQDSLWHRMNPVSKIALLATVNYFTSMIQDWVWKLPLFVIMLFFLRMSKAPSSFWKLLKISLSVQILNRIRSLPWTIFYTRQGFFKRLPWELVSKVIIEVTPEGFPILGRTALTFGSLYYSLCFFFNGPILLISTMIFLYSTNPSDLMHLLYKFRVPDGIVFSFFTAWRYVPMMVQQFGRVMNAQRLRGGTVKTRNPVVGARKVSPLIYAISRHSLDLNRDLTRAVLSRGFGYAKARPKEIHFGRFDTLFLPTLILTNVVLTYGVYSFNWGII